MVKRLIVLTALGFTLTLSALAQQRSATPATPVRHAAPFENAVATPARNTASIFSRAQGTISRPYEVGNTARRYTAAAPLRILGDGTTVYGSIIYADNWRGQSAKYGLYSFEARENTPITEVLPFESYQANGGGTYADGKYYYNSYVYTDEMGYTFSTFITLDVATGESTRVTQSFIQGTFDQTQITHDLTYDPTTGTVYAIAYIKETDPDGIIEYFRPAISTLDTYTGFVTPIAKTPGLIAIACNSSGELFGVSKGYNSTLYRINKQSGECTAIGPTGLNPEYVQSAAFDPVTDKLYWAETELNGTSGFYQVDTTTGAASLIFRFPNNEEFTGIYIPEPAVEAGAPAAATDLGADFVDGALTGNIFFTVPTLAADGSRLSGALTADITVDGHDFATVDCTPGRTVTKAITLAEGVHGFAVSIANEHGSGPRTGFSWYAGIDAPAAVTGLTITSNVREQPVISWQAPTVGRNGGYIDPAQLTYTITRMPEVVEVASGLTATTFTDTEAFDAHKVSYVVTPYCGSRRGVDASTAEGLFGCGSLLPVTFGFDTKDDFNLCTIIDANGDYDAQYHWGAWMYGPEFPASGITAENPCVVYGFSPTDAADDWVIMPPFTSQMGKKYRVTFTLWTKGQPEKISVTAGPAATVAAQSVILPENTYTHKDKKTYTAELTASASGNYYVGFHCTSAKKQFYLYIDDVTIDEMPDTAAPAAVTDFTVTPGTHGALEATLSMKAPSLTAGGTALAALDRIDIFRGNDRTVIHSFAPVTPGQALSWTDTEPTQGFNTYRAVAVGASGEGEKALATAYIGYDIPMAVTELSLEEYEGYPTIRWIAPEQGINGGYINPDELVYRIMRSDGTLIDSHATGTEFVDRSLDPHAKQYFIYYQVEPISKAGIGDYALTEHIIYGDPYKGDFFESFSDVSLSTDPWTMFRLKGRNQLWGLSSQGYCPTCYPADSDGGLAVFSSTDAYAGDACRLVSPKLSLSDMQVPVLAFAVYISPDEGTINGLEAFDDRLIPELCLPDGSYVALDEPIYIDDPRYDSAWYLFTYDLSAYKAYDYVQLSFQGISGCHSDIHLDYISVENNIEDDLVAYSFSGPAEVKPGKTARYRLTVFNQGVNAAEGFKVTLRRDGVDIQTIEATGALASGKFASVDFNVDTPASDEGKTHVYTAFVDYPADLVPSNNTSNPVTTTVVAPDVPQVRYAATDVADNNDVTITWGDADALHVVDGFDSYAPFIIEDIGDYTLVDGDKGYTFGFTDINFDNSGSPQAFTILNVHALGIDMIDDFRAHSGSQVLAAFQACDANGSAIVNDDWLISPEVYGATEVSFWAKTANWEWGLESIEVLYSTTDKSTSSFTRLAAVPEVPKDWTHYTYQLPAGARYFAIRYNSNDKFLLYIDDLTYTSKCTLEGETLTGFKLSYDGRELATVDASTRSFTDTAVPAGLHTYSVVALFGDRVSKPVYVDATVGASAITEPAAQSLSIEGRHGYIAIDGAAGLKVSVANVAGIVLMSDDSADAYTVSLVPGVYIVTAGDTVRKVKVQ